AGRGRATSDASATERRASRTGRLRRRPGIDSLPAQYLSRLPLPAGILRLSRQIPVRRHQGPRDPGTSAGRAAQAGARPGAALRYPESRWTTYPPHAGQRAAVLHAGGQPVPARRHADSPRRPAGPVPVAPRRVRAPAMRRLLGGPRDRLETRRPGLRGIRPLRILRARSQLRRAAVAPALQYPPATLAAGRGPGHLLEL